MFSIRNISDCHLKSLHLPLKKVETFPSIYDYSSQDETVVTLGTFDGVHLGHQSILERVQEAATSLNAKSLLLTFFPHPRMVLQKEEGIKLLNTLSEKSDLLDKFGLDYLVIHPFDKNFANLSAEQFVKEILVDIFHTTKIIIGYDHRFGKNRSANIEDLERLGKKYGFAVEQISAREIEDHSISSTKIRKAIESGNITTANEYLGYPYFFRGTVVQGKKIGRTIGFPTANIQVDESYKLLPAVGIYVVRSKIDNQMVYGMLSVGYNPTVGDNPLSIEVNYLGFDEDLYDKYLEIELLERIRGEQIFSSLEALKEAIHKDQLFTENYIKNVEKSL